MRRISANQPYAAPPVGSVPPVLSGVVRRSRLAAGLTIAGLSLLLGACGSGPAAVPAATSAPPPAASPAVSETPFPTPSDSFTESASPFPEPSESVTEATTEPDPDESEKPPVLDKGASGRSLTTADFFLTPDRWADGRYDVAGQQDLPGVGGPLVGCRDEPINSSPTIELRLANNFTRLSMKVGQSDDSPSSSAEVNVKLSGNGKYLDVVRVPFNKIATVQVPVTGVNALEMQMWTGGPDCQVGTRVEAVLLDLKLE